MRCNKDQQILELIGGAFSFKQVTQSGDILKIWDTGIGTGGGFLIQAADDDRLSVQLNDIGFGVFGNNCGITEYGL